MSWVASLNPCKGRMIQPSGQLLASGEQERDLAALVTGPQSQLRGVASVGLGAVIGTGGRCAGCRTACQRPAGGYTASAAPEAATRSSAAGPARSRAAWSPLSPTAAPSRPVAPRRLPMTATAPSTGPVTLLGSGS